MALPNPNDKLVSSSESQTLTLKDLLHYQKETEKWSENTDVNTFRGNLEEQEQGEKLLKGIEKIRLGSEGSLQQVAEEQKDYSRTITESFKEIGKTIFKPLGRLTQNLNNVKFKEFGEEMFEATAMVGKGSEKVKTGFKELTNGIGALGPVINTFRTAIFKGVAVFNLLAGSLQIIFGIVGKLISGIGGLIGLDFGKAAKERKEQQEALKEQLKADQEKSQQEADEAEERLKATKEAIAKQQEKEKELDEGNLPLPVDVVNQAGEPVEAKPGFRGIEMPDGSYSMDAKIAEEQQEEESDKLAELAKLEAQQEKEAHDKRLKNEENLAKLEEDNEEKRAKGFKGLIARLNLSAMLGMMKFLGFAALLGGIIMALKNGVPGTITGITEVVKRSAVGLTRMVDKRIVQPFKKFTGIGVPKPAAGIPGDMVPKGAKPFEFEGKTYKAGDQLPKDVKMNADGTAKRMSGTPKTPPKPGVAKNIGKVASKALTPVAGIVETGLDIRDNSQKFESVKAAYEAGIPFIPDGAGGKRPMTKEEFELLEKAQKANFAGSFGRGAGAVGGAVAGAAALSWLGPFGLVVGGIGGAIIGARAGDDAATGLAEVFTGTENSQDMLNNLADALPEQPAEAIEEVQTEIANTRAMPQQQPAGVFNQQQVVNNQNNETISVGQTPFSNVQLEYSYGD